MKTSLLIAFLVALASPVAAQASTTGTVGFAGAIAQTTDDIAPSTRTVPAAAVSTVDADAARRAWRCRLLDYAMARKSATPWEAVMVEYR